MLRTTWNKSSYSESGNCLEARWAKSSYSAKLDGCVEARRADMVEVRDTKQHGQGPVLRFTPEAWQSFVDGLKA